MVGKFGHIGRCTNGEFLVYEQTGLAIVLLKNKRADNKESDNNNDDKESDQFLHFNWIFGAQKRGIITRRF